MLIKTETSAGWRDDTPIFLDVETTGLNFMKNCILEISAVDYKGKVLFSHKLMPSEKDLENAHPKALEINNFDLEVWKKEALSEEGELEFWKKAQKLWKGRILVGSNPAFDIRFISKELWEALEEEPSWSSKPLDIRCLGLQEFGTFRGLLSLSQSLHVKEPDHTSLQDTFSTREVCLKLLCMQYMDEVSKEVFLTEPESRVKIALKANRFLEVDEHLKLKSGDLEMHCRKGQSYVVTGPVEEIIRKISELPLKDIQIHLLEKFVGSSVSEKHHVESLVDHAKNLYHHYREKDPMSSWFLSTSCDENENVLFAFVQNEKDIPRITTVWENYLVRVVALGDVKLASKKNVL